MENFKLLSKKQSLWFGLGLIIFGLLFMLFLLIPIKQYNFHNYKYEDLTHKTYTFENYEEPGHRGSYYEVYVLEEDKPLMIDNIVQKEIKDSLLWGLESGEVIECYLTKSSKSSYAYEIVEIKCGNEVILSLDDYVSKHQKNAIVGIVIIPIIAMMIIIVGVVFLILPKIKEKKNGRNN